MLPVNRFEAPMQPPIQLPPNNAEWEAFGPQDAREQWRFARRCEVGNFAVPFTVALVQQDGQGREAWDSANRDAEVVERAVRLAGMLQAALDRAKPRA